MLYGKLHEVIDESVKSHVAELIAMIRDRAEECRSQRTEYAEGFMNGLLQATYDIERSFEMPLSMGKSE